MVRKNILVVLCLLMALTINAKPKKVQVPAVSVGELRTERMVNPMSLDIATPRLGWQIKSTQSDVKQTAYRLIVSSTLAKATKLEGDLWDTTVNTDQSQWITYAGKPLRSDTRCYWRVKVTTNKGESEWSDVALFNVGLLYTSDWSGQWIGLDRANPWDKEEEHSQLSSRYLRTEFTADKEIDRATLYISGLGMYEAFINGKRIGDQVLAPVPTDYRKTVMYNAYDVTSLLGEKNALGVVLGNGRYYTMQQKKKPYKITNFGYPKLRATLIILYKDGKRQVISSNDKWKLNADG
ncbi:MAG: alpha-L-rhamnosidase N-terminal domain-containing protein, partial [Prevotella sp.]|nr:alpha-L-rhamnosidase N-terminal domain-containing protein [Prevotella sp.]